MSAEKKCPPHRWVKGSKGEYCSNYGCGITFRDWTRGFGSNVRPKRVVR